MSDLKEPVNGLYTGPGGTGKTTEIADMAKLGKILLINAESGVKATALRLRGIPIENIEVYPDRDAGEEITFDGLENEWKRIREALHSDPDAYIGTGWDSITEIYKALLDDVVANAVVRAGRAGRERDRHFIDRADYGVMTEQVRNLVRKFRDLPCHFAVAALERREQDDDGSVVYQPAITPALQNDLIGWMDFVCVTSVAQVDGDDQFRGLFRPHSKYRGKDRLGVLPKWLVDPGFSRIVAYVEGSLDVDSDPVMKAAREAQARQNSRDLRDADAKAGNTDTDSAETESKANDKTREKVSA